MSLIAIVTVEKINIAYWYRCTNVKIPTGTHKHIPLTIPKTATHSLNIPSRDKYSYFENRFSDLEIIPKSFGVQCIEDIIDCQMEGPGLNKYGCT